MTHKLKLTKVGNSVGVVLPKDVLGQMGVTAGDVLHLVPNEKGGFELVPFDAAFEEEMRAAEDIMVRYKNALRELAK